MNTTTNGTANGHHATDGPNLDPADRAGALAVKRRMLGFNVAAKTRSGLGASWLDLLEFVEQSAADQREAATRQFLDGHESRHGAEARRMRHALDVAEVIAAGEDLGDEPEDEGGPSPFSLGLIDSETFFAETYTLEWLIKGAVVKGDSGVLGGPQKALKTSILIDEAISLGSATPFLGRFAVPEPVRVALISGESGRQIIQANAKQVCRARNLAYSSLGDQVFWGFALPQLSNAEHLAVLRKTIGDLGLGAILLDPLYLSLLAGSSGLDPKDMFQMGPLLADVSRACLEAGATPQLAHHFIKRREDPFGPPEMGELAYSGIGQFMRQWMLIARRERFDAETGVHKLHFHYGGSAGHSGEMHLDIDTGKIDDDFQGRKWSVTASYPSESRAAQQEQRQAEQARKADEQAQQKAAQRETEERNLMAEAIGIIRKRPGRAITVTQLRAATTWGKPKADRIIYRLHSDGFLQPTVVSTDMGRGRTEDYPGYELVGDPGDIQ